MLKRTIAKYAKTRPNQQIDEYELNCSLEEMRNLFEVEDDLDMMFVYQIKSKEQFAFFEKIGFNLDSSTGFYFVECCEE